MLFEKNMHTRRAIASLTKLMTAMVTLDADLPMDEVITITKDDRDRLPGNAALTGPLVIEESYSNTVVGPGHTARVDAHGNIFISIG